MRPFPVALPVLLLAVAALPVGAQPGSPARLDLTILASPLERWERVGEGGTADGPRYAFYQSRGRPLLVLHWWRPEGSPPADPDDVRRTVEAQRLRGGVTGFVETSLEGTIHRGHAAWVLEGLLDGGRTRVRYFLWYCEVTGRVFLAEARISLELETEQAWLDVLTAAVGTLACHGPIRQPEQVTEPPLEILVRADDLHFGLRLPRDWAWGVLGAEATDQAGSIWALPAGPVGMILLRRRDDRTGELAGFARDSLEMLAAVLTREGRTVQVLPEPMQADRDELRIRGVFTVRDPEWAWIEGTHKFLLTAFTAVGEQHVLLVSRLAATSIDGVPVEPAPGWGTIEHLMAGVRRAYRP
jgi:hypothetical protein